MGTYFPPLNLTLDADERAVKRAYAAALKDTRPDDDPAAFQALVAARDRALDWVRRRRAPVFADPGQLSGRSIPANDDATSLATMLPDLPQGETLANVSPADADRADKSADTTFGAPHATIVFPATAMIRPVVDVPTYPGAPEPEFAALLRTQRTSRHLLVGMAVKLIHEEAGGADVTDRWTQLLIAADDLDLAGRMGLERAIATELDAIMQQSQGGAELFAATVLTLDQAFRWSQDIRRVVRLLGEPSGAHPLVFAVERFGENAVRLRFAPDGFPIIPDGDLAAWFGGSRQAGVRAYAKAAETGRFAIGWSWYAFLSPPAWAIRMGAPVAGIGFAVAAIVAIYVLFDPIADVGTANSFAAFLAVLIAARSAAAVAARPLETSALVKVIKRIETRTLPPLGERRRLIANAHGSKILNVIVGLCFLLLVDGYCLALIIPAMTLGRPLVAEMIVVPDRKTQGVTFADRLVAESYLDHAREIAEAIDDLLKDTSSGPPNPLRQRRIAALQQRFLDYIKALPVGDYVHDFDRFRRQVAALKRQD